MSKRNSIPKHLSLDRTSFSTSNPHCRGTGRCLPLAFPACVSTGGPYSGVTQQSGHSVSCRPDVHHSTWLLSLGLSPEPHTRAGRAGFGSMQKHHWGTRVFSPLLPPQLPLQGGWAMGFTDTRKWDLHNIHHKRGINTGQTGGSWNNCWNELMLKSQLCGCQKVNINLVRLCLPAGYWFTIRSLKMMTQALWSRPKFSADKK